jgi:GAF domain-containing protein
VAEYLFRQGQMMPSVYLEHHGELRCTAQRGLWQVLDGMPGSAGITGRTWTLGRPTIVPDVSADPDYLEAIPGVVAEICVPIGAGPKPLGALNVESLVPLPTGTLELLEQCADLLAKRLEEVGRVVYDSAWQRAVKASVAISGVTAGGHAPRLLLGHLSSAARLDSAALVLDGPEGSRVTAAIGPLAGPMSRLSKAEIGSLSSLVGDIRSCYTAGDASGRGFAGTGSLRDGGARAVVVLPLWAWRRRLGTIVIAHSRPVHLTSDDVTPLEMLSDHIASVLAAEPNGSSLSRATTARPERSTPTPDLSAGATLADAMPADQADTKPARQKQAALHRR